MDFRFPCCVIIGTYLQPAVMRHPLRIGSRQLTFHIHRPRILEPAPCPVPGKGVLASSHRQSAEQQYDNPLNPSDVCFQYDLFSICNMYRRRREVHHAVLKEAVRPVIQGHANFLWSIRLDIRERLPGLYNLYGPRKCLVVSAFRESREKVGRYSSLRNYGNLRLILTNRLMDKVFPRHYQPPLNQTKQVPTYTDP